MLKITGSVHIRLLLHPDVPFVRSASISLPRLPDFDFAAKPIKELGLDFMGLPFIKPYRTWSAIRDDLPVLVAHGPLFCGSQPVEKSILEVADSFVRPKSYKVDVDVSNITTC